MVQDTMSDKLCHDLTDLLRAYRDGVLDRARSPLEFDGEAVVVRDGDRVVFRCCRDGLVVEMAHLLGLIVT